MIKLDSLSCSYDNEKILSSVDLEISSHLSILGANGSGKSTLVRSICGLIDYDGKITIDEVDIKSLSNILRAKTISYIPPKLELYDPYITLYEFVLLGRFVYKRSFFEYTQEDSAIAKKNIDLLGLKELQNHTMLSLSSGEQQLALIASALSQESKIIIFDEPTANLDPHNAKIVANHIKNLKNRHQIILITHDLHLAYFIDSPVAFIKDKKISLFESGFFDDEILRDLYGVEFCSLVLKYE